MNSAYRQPRCQRAQQSFGVQAPGANGGGVETLEDRESVAGLVILALVGHACRSHEAIHDVAFRRVFRIWVSGSGVGFELAAVEVDEGLSVGKEPRFHALHHQVDLIGWDLHRASPSVTALQVGPRRGALCNGIFRVHQKDGARVRFLFQRAAEIVACFVAAATRFNSRLRAFAQRLPEKLDKSLFEGGACSVLVASALRENANRHQRFPPIWPFRQSSPRLYFCSQASNWLASRR